MNNITNKQFYYDSIRLSLNPMIMNKRRHYIVEIKKTSIKQENAVANTVTWRRKNAVWIESVLWSQDNTDRQRSS